MASIEPRYNKAGQLMHYRLIVSGGLNWEGKQIKRTTTWKPPRPNMSKKQMEREAMAAAFKFEEAIQAGYDIDKVKRFCDYADYVLDLKERNGLAPTTIERYRDMLPRINDAIGHLKLTQIRPQHLNDFYKTLSENGVRNLGAIAVAKKVLKKKVEALGQPKHVIAKESGIAHTTLNAILNGDAVKLETAEGIAKALGYTVSELFTVSDRKKPLSNKTILEHHRLISMILAQADKEMLASSELTAVGGLLFVFFTSSVRRNSSRISAMNIKLHAYFVCNGIGSYSNGVGINLVATEQVFPGRKSVHRPGGKLIAIK